MKQSPFSPPRPPIQTAFAEVMESSLYFYLAQSWQWDAFPQCGELVQVENNNHYIVGIVTEIQTGSMDPVRYPFPYKKTEEELLAEQPQIFEFLKTTFKVHIVGYVETSGKCFYLLPPKPCKIHAFVTEAPPSIRKKFFECPDYLHLLFAFSAMINNLDELLLAIIRQLALHHLLTPPLLEEFAATFSMLSGNDYRRLKLFLKRAQEIM